MKGKRKFQIEQKYVDYFEKTVPEVIALEDKLAEIKGSEEWKKAYNYFNLLTIRGHLVERPTRKNGYAIKLSDGMIQIEELKDIVTAEQMEKIKELLGK